MSCIVICLTTAWMILKTDPLDYLAFSIAGCSSFYTFGIFLLMAGAYSSNTLYPKPSHYCIFPISSIGFLKINVAYLLKRKVMLIVLVVPLTYLAVDLHSYLLKVVIIVASYAELLFLLVVGSFLFHLLESKNNYQVFQIVPALTTIVFYAAYKLESFWPLILNPLGTFIFAPIVLWADDSSIYPGCVIIIIMLLSFYFFIKKTLRDWLI